MVKTKTLPIYRLLSSILTRKNSNILNIRVIKRKRIPYFPSTKIDNQYNQHSCDTKYCKISPTLNIEDQNIDLNDMGVFQIN